MRLYAVENQEASIQNMCLVKLYKSFCNWQPDVIIHALIAFSLSLHSVKSDNRVCRHFAKMMF